MDSILAGLNSNQLKAVTWNTGPLLVLAGPGSGKTKVLTLRVAKLILDSPNERFRVLGLTFTNKAAHEMRTRVDLLVQHGRERALLTTFHSFAADILRQHGSHLGIRPDFVILNQDPDRRDVLTESFRVLEGRGVSCDAVDVRLLPFITNLIETCADKGEVDARLRDHLEAAKIRAVYDEYRQQLKTANRLDFPSLLSLAYELLVAVPAVPKQIRAIYKHICIDEFQDTNHAQYRLLRAICGGRAENLFVVADDDQIIYQWNGASPERLRQLQNDYGMGVIQLPANYRSPPDVITLANRLIVQNPDRTEGKEPLVAIKAGEGAPAVTIREFDSHQEELNWLVDDLGGRPSSDRGHCVVLVRTQQLARGAAAALQSAGLNAIFSVRKDEFETPEFRWLHGVLRLASARSNLEQLQRICASFYKLEGLGMEIEDVIASAALANGDYLRGWFEQVLLKELNVDLRQFVTGCRRDLTDAEDFRAFISRAIAWFDNRDRADDGERPDYEEEKQTWTELQRAVSGKYGASNVSLPVLLQEFDLAPKTAPVPQDAIQCMTIHGAKGMEFEYVYLIGLAEEVFPSFQSIQKGENSPALQEERRSCFVAITRTERCLCLSYAREYSGWPKEPSRFLKEMGLVQRTD